MNQFEHGEEAIFDLARRIESPELRAEYVDQACGTNGELKNRIAELLMTYDREQSFLEHPPAELACTTAAQSISENLGDVIGPYKLLQQIGEGGFGVVYMAEQSRPVKRKVALKIIKPGMDSKEVVARFEAERQALALMDHPNIAKVFDGGVTDTGRPYFVMELVKGVPVTEFCDSNKLATSDRLELFVEVCRAIQHAHQKGVIHRDIKPSNVMVTLHDNRPVPKVIDFGVAKAISQELTEKTMFTTYGQMIGTPQYMSPEQAQMSGLDIDTRSDVYSLGVLLYELLTGTTPLDINQLRGTAYAQLQKLICEIDPPKPSTKVSGLGKQSIEIASNRGVDTRKLNSQLRGDLDWIVMKALEKDRNRRFESAGSFAGDIQRYLSDQPILARPPSTAYQLRKFVRRNRAKVLTGAGCIILLVTSVSIWVVKHEQDRTMNELKQQTTNLTARLDQQILDQVKDDALEAIQSANLKNLDAAISRAERVGVPGIWLELLKGRQALANRNWRRAMSHFNAAIDEDNESLAPRANLVLAYAQNHQVDKMVATAETLDRYEARTSYDFLFKAEAESSRFDTDYSQALNNIRESLGKKTSLAAYIVRARLLASRAAITGETELVERALLDSEVVHAMAQDVQAAIRLKFLIHTEAARILRAYASKTDGDRQHERAKELLARNDFLREPHHDLALIQFYEYSRSHTKVYDLWKAMVHEKQAVGGAAGMYGVYAIRMGKAEFQEALETLRKIDKSDFSSASLNSQLGIMELFAGNRDEALEQYRAASEAETPLVCLYGQWIALLLRDRESLESVKQYCRDLRNESAQLSKWERLMLDALSGNLHSPKDVLDAAGNDRRLAVQGLVSLALVRLSEANPENWDVKQSEAKELLEETLDVHLDYFGRYLAEAILKEWESNSKWPMKMSKEEVDTQRVGE